MIWPDRGARLRLLKRLVVRKPLSPGTYLAKVTDVKEQHGRLVTTLEVQRDRLPPTNVVDDDPEQVTDEEDLQLPPLHLAFWLFVAAMWWAGFIFLLFQGTFNDIR